MAPETQCDGLNALGYLGSQTEPYNFLPRQSDFPYKYASRSL